MNEPQAPEGYTYGWKFSQLVDLICNRCGAVVADTIAHSAWHEEAPTDE